MATVRLRSTHIPECLQGWVAIGSSVQPRFWATVWADVLLAHIDESTRAKHLAAVENLYQSVTRQVGKDQLDRAIAEADFDTLEACLGGFLTQLRNRSAMAGTNEDKTWESALRFLGDVLNHLGRRSGTSMKELEARLVRLRGLYSQLAPTPPADPKPVRALPAAVVEDLYELFNPTSNRNP